MKSLGYKSIFPVIFVLGAYCFLSAGSPAPPDRDIGKFIAERKLDRSKISIHIDKSDYCLSLKIDTVVLKSYPVVFGSNPIDDKLRQGDMCTPEGRFKIRAQYPHADWTKFIWLDYPTKDSWRKHNEAKKNKTIPANASIGGEIGIHGVPEGYDAAIDHKQNWTWGCISLKTKDINEVYQWVKPGTVVVITK